jgi:hypothetical protein
MGRTETTPFLLRKGMPKLSRIIVCRTMARTGFVCQEAIQLLPTVKVINFKSHLLIANCDYDKIDYRGMFRGLEDADVFIFGERVPPGLTKLLKCLASDFLYVCECKESNYTGKMTPKVFEFELEATENGVRLAKQASELVRYLSSFYRIPVRGTDVELFCGFLNRMFPELPPLELSDEEVWTPIDFVDSDNEEVKITVKVEDDKELKNEEKRVSFVEEEPIDSITPIAIPEKSEPEIDTPRGAFLSDRLGDLLTNATIRLIIIGRKKVLLCKNQTLPEFSLPSPDYRKWIGRAMDELGYKEYSFELGPIIVSGKGYKDVSLLVHCMVDKLQLSVSRYAAGRSTVKALIRKIDPMSVVCAGLRFAISLLISLL